MVRSQMRSLLLDNFIRQCFYEIERKVVLAGGLLACGYLLAEVGNALLCAVGGLATCGLLCAASGLVVAMVFLGIGGSGSLPALEIG